MGSYTISVVEDNETTKEAHFETKAGKRWKDASSKHRIYPKDL